MRYTKHIEHKINMGPYETLTIGASIDWEDGDFTVGTDPEDPDVILSSLVKKELSKAEASSQADSYIHDWVLNDV